MMLKCNTFFLATASVCAFALSACGEDRAADADGVRMAGDAVDQDAAPEAPGEGEGDPLNTLPDPDAAPGGAPDATPAPIESAAASAPVEDYGEPGARADFEFLDSVPGSGAAWFFESGEGVRVYARMRGMAPGAYAIHVHETGDCSARDFTSAGDHLGVDAGAVLPDKPDDFEAGMLPDIMINQDGAGDLNTVLEVVRLTEDTERTWPLFDDDGAAIVIHRFATGDLALGQDNPRIACAEIYESDL